MRCALDLLPEIAKAGCDGAEWICAERRVRERDAGAGRAQLQAIGRGKRAEVQLIREGAATFHKHHAAGARPLAKRRRAARSSAAEWQCVERLAELAERLLRACQLRLVDIDKHRRVCARRGLLLRLLQV